MTSLSKKYRLTSREVKRVFAQSKRRTGDGLTVIYIKNNKQNSRFTIVVSSKIAKKSALRNKMRRQTKDAIQDLISFIKKGYDVIIVFKRAFSSKKEITGSLTDALKENTLLDI